MLRVAQIINETFPLGLVIKIEVNKTLLICKCIQLTSKCLTCLRQGNLTTLDPHKTYHFTNSGNRIILVFYKDFLKYILYIKFHLFWKTLIESSYIEPETPLFLDSSTHISSTKIAIMCACSHIYWLTNHYIIKYILIGNFRAKTD